MFDYSRKKKVPRKGHKVSKKGTNESPGSTQESNNNIIPDSKGNRVPISTIRDSIPDNLPNPTEAELVELMDTLTLKMAKYLIARLALPHWALARCARVAGYSKKTATTAANHVERKAHIQKILAFPRSKRGLLDSDNDALEIDRESLISMYSHLINSTETPDKVRLEAARDLRSLEAWDKQHASASNSTNILAVIMNQIDGSTGTLPAQIHTNNQLLPSFEANNGPQVEDNEVTLDLENEAKNDD